MFSPYKSNSLWSVLWSSSVDIGMFVVLIYTLVSCLLHCSMIDFLLFHILKLLTVSFVRDGVIFAVKFVSGKSKLGNESDNVIKDVLVK